MSFSLNLPFKFFSTSCGVNLGCGGVGVGSFTSNDTVTFDMGSCAENGNHVQSSGAEDASEKSRDTVIKNAELSPICPGLTPPDTKRADKDDQPQHK